MAKSNPNLLPEPDPLISLTEEARKHIEELDKEIEENRKDLDALEAIGFDATMPRERLKWAEDARKIILERFPRGQ